MNKTGVGIVTLTGNNALFTGPINITGGAISVNAISTSGNTGLVTLDGGRIINTNSGNAGSYLSSTRNISLGTGGGTLEFSTAQLIIYDGAISGVGGLTTTGPGAIAMTGNNTYQGPTLVASGTLRVRTTSERFPDTTALTVNSGASFDLNGLSETVGSLAGAGSVTTGSGTFTVGDATSTLFSGVIQGTNGKVTKTGTGTLSLTGTNTYTGATTINAGTLAVGTGGSLASASAVAVNNTGTLAGTGAVNGSVTVASGGTLAPGASGAGTLTIGGNTILNTGSTLAIGAAADGANSSVNVLGSSTTFDFKSGSILDLALLSGFSNASAASYTLVTMPAGSGGNIQFNGGGSWRGIRIRDFHSRKWCERRCDNRAIRIRAGGWRYIHPDPHRRRGTSLIPACAGTRNGVGPDSRRAGPRTPGPPPAAPGVSRDSMQNEAHL